MKTYDIAIIGGGAAGMMAAIWASQHGKSVIVIEKNDKLGKKVYATGNGRCNLTNLNINPSRYYGSNSYFISNVINQFDQFKTIKFFNQLKVITKEEANGRIFPQSDKAASVVNALENELKNNKVEVMHNTIVKDIKKSDKWQVQTINGDVIISNKLIISTGGNVANQFGSIGDGYEWSKSLGHTIVETYSALVPIETKEGWVKNLQGITVKATIKIIIDGVVVSEKYGDLLFTHFGLTGPAIMSQAVHVAKNDNTKSIIISIDLFSDKTLNEIDKELKELFDNNGSKIIKNCLVEVVPQKISDQIVTNLKIDADLKSARISKVDRLKIANNLKNLILTPKGVSPQSEAQVTSGGVNTNEIDYHTMESKIISDLFFAGEVVDVDGDSGGFNLQWAWSSGYVAGISAGASVIAR